LSKEKEGPMGTDEPFDLSQQILSMIRTFLDEPNENTLWQNPGELAWAHPLVGFSQGSDPLWNSLKVIPYIQSNYGFDGYSCGLCQTCVPCESKIPLNDK
jgi:hypothetical protein